MFSSRSHLNVVGREARKKTVTACPITAREKPIWLYHGKVNRVRRIGAFSWGKPKKLPWVRAVAAELASCLPVNAETRKEVRRLQIGGCCGGATRPSGRLADCQPGYTSFSATARFFQRAKMGTTPRFSVGATTDPRHGCSVNTAECVGRLIRFTKALPSRGVALTGGDALPRSRDNETIPINPPTTKALT